MIQVGFFLGTNIVFSSWWWLPPLSIGWHGESRQWFFRRCRDPKNWRRQCPRRPLASFFFTKKQPKTKIGGVLKGGAVQGEIHTLLYTSQVEQDFWTINSNNGKPPMNEDVPLIKDLWLSIPMLVFWMVIIACNKNWSWVDSFGSWCVFFGPGSILTFLGGFRGVRGFRGVKLLLSWRESQKNFAPCCSSKNHWVTVASHRPRSMLMRVRMPMFPKMGAVRRRKPNHARGEKIGNGEAQNCARKRAPRARLRRRAGLAHRAESGRSKAPKGAALMWLVACNGKCHCGPTPSRNLADWWMVIKQGGHVAPAIEGCFLCIAS